MLGYPVEIWIAVAVAVIVRLRSSMTLGWIGALTTTLVGLASGVLLYKPVANLFGLGADWHTMIAILVALTAENLMKGIVDFSNHPDAAKRVVTAIITRDPKHLVDDDDDGKS